MQDMLTENVELQEKQLDDINYAVMGATDNIERGNDEVCRIFTSKYYLWDH